MQCDEPAAGRITSGRAFGEFLLASIVLHFFVVNFIG